MTSSPPPPQPCVLIVDDEGEVLESLRRALRREPYILLTASSAAEAIELLDTESVDLLLSDIDMPSMDGLELVAWARLHHPHIVRMLLTGDASLDSVLVAINTGEVHRYFLKPWENDELRVSLRHAIERKTELARLTEAAVRVGQRERLLRSLEAAHPGIRSVTWEGGAYVLEVARLRETAAASGLEQLVALFADRASLTLADRAEGEK